MKIQVKLSSILFLSLTVAILFWFAPNIFQYPVQISMVLKTPEKEMAQVFFTTRFRGFNQGQSVVSYYDANDNFLNVDLAIKGKMVKGLRIDPVENATEFELQSLLIEVGKQKKNISGSELAEYFHLVNVETAGVENGIIKLRQINNPDVQLIFKHSIPEFFNLKQHKAIRIFYWLLAAFYFTGVLLIIFFGKWLRRQTKTIICGINATTSHFPDFNTVYEFILKNKMIILFSLLTAIFTFGYELFNFSLSIDEEIDSFRSAANGHVFIIVGRWGLYMLNLFFQPTSLTPYYPTLLALIFLSATSVIFVTSISGSISSKMVFTMLFISNPIHTYYLTFNTSGFYYALGMALTSLAFVLFKNTLNNNKGKHIKYLGAILLVGFSISLYQINIVLFIVFSAYYLFANIWLDNKVDWKKIGAYILGIAVIGIPAFLFYKFGDIAARYLFLPDNLTNKATYLDNFNKWGVWPTNQIIHHLFDETIGYIFGTGSAARQLGLSFTWLFPIIILLAVQTIFSKKMWLQKTLSLMVLIFLILSPFILTFLSGASMPVRTMIPITLMIGLLWLIAYQRLGSFFRKIMFLGAIIILINNTFINSRLFYATYLSWQADRDIANRIIERIYQLNPPLKNGIIKVAWAGNYSHQANELFIKSETHGASFFEWNPGEPYRIVPFFKTIGINELRTVPLRNLEHRKDEIEAMPSWPDHGSVNIFDTIVVVKFSHSDISWKKN